MFGDWLNWDLIRNLKLEIEIMFIFYFLLLTTFSLLFVPSVYAVCPVCIVAVGAGVGLSRWLGIDDTVSGVWIGGMVVALSVATANWLKKKWPNLKFLLPISFTIYSLMAALPFWNTDIVGHSLNRLWGIDKLILGTVTGVILFVVGTWLDKRLRARNEGKVYFSYQKVVVPVFSLVLGSLVFFFLTK